MEFYEAVHKRRSIRQFEDRPIARETIERIVEAGLAAPSSNHQRRWQLVVLTEKDRIVELSRHIRNMPRRFKEARSPQQEMMQISYPRQRSMVAEAACVIVPTFHCKYPISEEGGGWGLNDYGAAWALIENMLLAATAEGLSSGVHIPVRKEPAEIHEFLGIPEPWRLPALVVLGHPAAGAETPRQVEVSVDKNVHWQTW
ncbi:nitroreductase family protein [Propionibacterium australiense]|uniref:Nitroreductase n=1 Tax=Propionibacterium australiense TaxID=119981 RepID=A0A383S930_9ACTN|nr:nitroreductase family protein [Propionibacterium australiense]RLP06595.1 nitroreductase [Propionibacterium australiense]RLP10761.1 nitroreductase [Propionibacterium australiense]SYZ34417.1 Nitroreductase family [Propionibacterium australiense]VEH89850.1 F420-0--gamma-glutamyl ligase [Propionibacterium australiense]